jgi:hypothetical protein
VKKKFFLCVALTALIATFFGCSNMLNTTVSNDSTVSGMPIQISLAKKAGRYVKAVENWSIESDVYAWKVKFTEESTGATEVGYWDNNYDITHDEEETITVVYDSDKKTFGMSKVATGTYTLEIMSTSTSDAFTVYGKTTDFVIDSEKTNSKTMFIDLKRETTGNLSLTFTFSGNITSNDINGKLKAVLTPLTGDGDTKEYTVSTDESAEFKATLDDSSNVTDLTLTVSSLNSGFYKLSFTDLNTDTKYKYWVSTDCQVVEIADDTETTAFVSLNRSTEKNYFATNDSTKVGYNGLSASSPDEINELLTSFTTELPENSYINVYMDSSVPVIEASTIKALQNSLGNSTDYQIAITVYQSQSSSIVPSLIIETTISDSTTTVNTYIHGDVAIKAANDVTDVAVTKIGKITSNDDIDINAKLVDGATITTTEITDMGDNKLYLSAETSAGVDNLSAYTDSPMLTISNDASNTASSLVEIKSESYKARFDTSSTDAGTVTFVYAQLVGSGTTSITKFASNASIAAIATASDSTTKNYTTGAVIPYNSDTVTFSLSGVTSDITAYSWLLNSNTVGSESTMSLTPTKSKYVDLDGTNTVSLSVQINDTWYLTEFTFTFSSTDYSHAVYITSSDSNYALNEIEYNNASATSKDLGSITANSTTAFTFDDSQNLWILSYSDYLKLTKQSKLVSDSTFANGSCTEYELTNIAFSSTPRLDITYDTKNKVIYVLATEETANEDSSYTYTTKIYAFATAKLTDSTTSADSTVTINTTTWTSALTSVTSNFDFTKLAVNNTTVYLADSAYNVFKLTDFTDSTISPSYVGNLATELNITEGTDYLTLTDMQIGDGLGNDTDNLYVLMRQYSTDCIQPSANTYYSRGALCKIDSSNTVTSYGFSTTSITDTKNTSYTTTFYTPGESPSNVAFYGPICFAAVNPKKLVIADDGFYYTNDGDNGTLTNKDGFLVFDIDATTDPLTRTSADESIGIPNSTTYAKANYE